MDPCIQAGSGQHRPALRCRAGCFVVAFGPKAKKRRGVCPHRTALHAARAERPTMPPERAVVSLASLRRRWPTRGSACRGVVGLLLGALAAVYAQSLRTLGPPRQEWAQQTVAGGDVGQRQAGGELAAATAGFLEFTVCKGLCNQVQYQRASRLCAATHNMVHRPAGPQACSVLSHAPLSGGAHRGGRAFAVLLATRCARRLPERP